MTQIVLQLASNPGVHLRVVGKLKKLGLQTTDLKLKAAPTGAKILELEVDNALGLTEQEIQESLNEVDGVVEAIRVGDLISDNAAQLDPETAASAPPEPTEDEKRFRNLDSEAGDEDIRDRMLVFSLLSRYPNLAARLIELRNSIPEDEREARFYQIGCSFGKQLFNNLKIDATITNVDSAIERVLLPGIRPLAQVSAAGSLLKIDVYSKKFDRGVPNPINCMFMQGMIDGLLMATAGLPACRAYKTKCVHTQDVICEYNIATG